MRKFLTFILSYRVLLSVILYGLVLLIAILHHELWREEMQGWLIAKDARSLLELYHNLRYEAHPMLWYMCIFLISRFTTDPLWMQLFTWLLAMCTAFVFLQFAPFSFIHRILFVFGYFMLFEYGVMSRNYLLGIVLLFLGCIFLRSHKLLWAVIALFLAMQTSIMALIVASFLAFYLIFSAYSGGNSWKGIVVIVALGIGVSLIQIIPPRDFGITVDWVTHLDIRRLGMVWIMLWRGYISFPSSFSHFWNSTILIPAFRGGAMVGGWESWLTLCLAALGSGMLLVVSIKMLIRERVLLGVYLAGSVALLLFFYVFYYGAIRHWGFLFILLLCVLWLSQRKLSAWSNNFLTLLLLVQVAAGGVAILSDYYNPFSAAQAASVYINELDDQSLFLVGTDDTAAVAVAGYLNSQLYYPQESRMGTFAILTGSRRRELTDQELLRDIKKRMKTTALLINTKPLPGSHCGISHLRDFTDSITPDRYYIYLIRRKDCL